MNTMLPVPATGGDSRRRSPQSDGAELAAAVSIYAADGCAWGLTPFGGIVL
jgi:hypothetical protein